MFQGFEFPKEGTVSFTYVVTRPKRGLLKARSFNSTFFQLDLNTVRDYKLATALRTMCLGVNSSCSSVIANCRWDGRPVLFAQIVDESWSLPTAGAIEFSFVPCVGVGKETGDGWIDSVCGVMRGLSDDVLRFDFLKGTLAVHGGFFNNLQARSLRKIVDTMEEVKGKRDAFLIYYNRVEDILGDEGLVSLGIELMEGRDWGRKQFNDAVRNERVGMSSPRVEKDKEGGIEFSNNVSVRGAEFVEVGGEAKMRKKKNRRRKKGKKKGGKGGR